MEEGERRSEEGEDPGRQELSSSTDADEARSSAQGSISVLTSVAAAAKTLALELCERLLGDGDAAFRRLERAAARGAAASVTGRDVVGGAGRADAALASLPWHPYRSGVDLGDGPTTDAGWGCAYRSSQMAVAGALTRRVGG